MFRKKAKILDERGMIEYNEENNAPTTPITL